MTRGRRRPARQPLRILLAALVVTGTAATSGAAVGAGGAGGRGSGGDASAPRVAMRLVEQPAWVPLGFEFAAQLAVDGPRAGLDLRVEVHERLVSRLTFERTTFGQSLGGVLERIEAPLADAERVDGGDDVRVAFRLQAPGNPPDPASVALDGTGVYPVRVTLRDADGAVVDELVSWLVAVGPDPVDHPLHLAWIWPVVADPLLLPDGAPDPAVLDEYAPEGRLGEIAAVVDGADVPLTLALGPETASSWSAASDDDPALAPGIDVLRGAVDAGHQVLAAPWVLLDLPALVDAGMGGELQPRLDAGVEGLERLLDARVDTRTAFVEPVDPGALAQLRRDALIDRVVVRERSLEPRSSQLTPAEGFLLAAGGTRIDAAATSDTLAGLLEGPGSRALRAQRLLAGLSLVALESPADQRGVVLAGDVTWAPDTEMLAHVVAGLRDHPLIATATLDEWFDAVPGELDDDGAEVERALVPIEAGPVPIGAEALERARADLESLTSIVGADDPRVQLGQTMISTAPSATYTTPAERARARTGLGRIGDDARSFLAGISTTDKTITLTGQRAEIPLTFRNETGATVRVRVNLESPKLVFPDGGDRVLELPPGNTTARFRVEARTTGAFRLVVTTTSEDGRFQAGPPVQVTVRTTLFGGVGAWLTGGSLAFLAIWWVSHLWRGRRSRSRAPAPGAA